MANDIILKIDGIPGECQLDGHKNEIDVDSVSWGLANHHSMSSGGGGGSGKVQFQEIHFSKHFDASSHLIQQKCADGKHIPSALITLRKQGEGQKEYIKITLTDVLISSYSGSQGGEQFGLAFSKIKFQYAPQKKDGSLEAYKDMTWDIKANKA